MIEKVWYILYNAVMLPALYAGIHFLGFFNSKIRRGIEGRRNLNSNLSASLQKLNRGRKLIWFHSSSMGEFEQAKPIIEELRKSSNVNILVTFFSPSGYENSKKYAFADIVTYIPFDSRAAISSFSEIAKPSLVVLMRYDVWPNHINVLHDKGIPVLLVDATMRTKNLRKNSFLRGFHKQLYSKMEKILTISDLDTRNFGVFGIPGSKLKQAGDTRFDRVYIKSRDAKTKNILRPGITEGKKIFIAGSTWEEDEEILNPVILKLLKYHKDLLVIIVPHEPTVNHIEKLEQEFPETVPTIRFSYLNNYNNERVIIVDSIGILLTLYSHASIAFVGGSYKSNVHNVLEAAVYGIPVLYGPKIHSSAEASHLAETGGGFIIENKTAMYKTLTRLLSNESLRLKAGKAAGEFVKTNTGATSVILSEIKKLI